LVEERDIDIPEMRSIDSSHETVQILARSSIFQVCESREDNTFLWRRGQAEVVSARREGIEMK